MARIFEEISNAIANSAGKPDANLANDSNHLGGVPADEYATKKYVQNYHDNKEANQKEYIDQQDQAMLEASKEYTNAQIRNQDFSNFAELSDVEALNENLSNQLENCKKECANNLKTKTDEIVKDVNANFDGVNTAIQNLNKGQTDLFQSVSDGKRKVAEAITDKGVQTSATDTFDTMAKNVRAIPTNGGEIDPNFVNTSDGDATASDIRLGKTAYVKGQKIYGTLIPTSEYPTYGTDTSNATATEADIAFGKTAYARGQLLTGTVTYGNNTESGEETSAIKEIYGVSGAPYTIDTLSSLAIEKPSYDPTDTSAKVSKITIAKFSYNGEYCVRNVVAGGINYIESFRVSNTDSIPGPGLYYEYTTDSSGNYRVKKYRYTYEELGLTDDNGNIATEILDIAFGASGFVGGCALSILFKVEESVFLKFITYHLRDEGIIGKSYLEESNVIDLKQSVSNNYLKIVGSPTEPRCFYMFSYRKTGDWNATYYLSKVEINSEISGSGYKITITNGKSVSASDDYKLGKLTASLDGNYVFIPGEKNFYIFDIRENIPSKFFYGDSSSGLTKSTYLEGLNKILTLNVDPHEPIIKVSIYSISGTGTSEHSLVLERNDVTLKLTPDSRIYNNLYGMIYTTKDNSRLIFLVGYQGRDMANISPVKLFVFDLEKILLSTETETIEAVQEEDFYPTTIYDELSKYSIEGNIDDTAIHIHHEEGTYSNRFLSTLINTLDKEYIVGVIYKNQYFNRIKEHILTAGQPDVKSGKTFIGWMGYPETGTMEVESSE